MRDKPDEALNQFEECVKLEEELDDGIEYRFKAMENIVVLAA